MNPKRIVTIFSAALAALAVVVSVCAFAENKMSETDNMAMETGMKNAPAMGRQMPGLEVATFAGGCFW